MYRSGHVALLGKPNAGKSTLLNALVGARLAAVSPLPQTTREKFFGILSSDEGQIIFADLPGLIDATDKLNEVLRENVLEGLKGVDVVLHLVDVADEEPITTDVASVLATTRTPAILAITKIDGKRASVDVGSWVGERLTPEQKNLYRQIIGISAKDRKGLAELEKLILGFLPEGGPLYDPESMTDRDLRFLAAEMIREKTFYFLHEEIPYSTAVVIEEFKERSQGKWYIRAVIYVERDSQKGIVIGRGGDSLKKISTAARKDIEELCEAPVYLELFVKVREKWRKDERALREFGYKQTRKGKR